MAACHKLAKCLFFHDRLPRMPLFASLTKASVCLGTPSKCARMMVIDAGADVPVDLMPNDLERARDLVEREELGPGLEGEAR